MNNYQDYFFEKESDVLFVNEDTQKVGVLNSDPQFTLDVNGIINTSNILGVNALLSNLQSDYIVADTAIIDDITANNLHALSNVSASNLISQSNLKLLNTWISDQCPKPNNGSLFGFSLGGGVIDPSWLKVDTDWAAFLESAWNALQSGYDLFTLARSIFDENDALAEELKDAISDALSNGGLKVPWGTVSHKPLFAGELTKNVGVAGHLYLSKSKIIYAIDENNFSTANPDNNLDLTTSAGRVEIINLSNQDAFLRDVSCSNITSSNITTSNMLITSNLQVPIVNANTIITGSVSSVDLVRCGEFYITQDAIYLGNPSNPLTSQLIIDNQGNYKGTIDKGQITDLEAWNFKAMADGNLVFGEFGDTSILNDPFASTNTAIFSIT